MAAAVAALCPSRSVEMMQIMLVSSESSSSWSAIILAFDFFTLCKYPLNANSYVMFTAFSDSYFFFVTADETSTIVASRAKPVSGTTNLEVPEHAVFLKRLLAAGRKHPSSTNNSVNTVTNIHRA